MKTNWTTANIPSQVGRTALVTGSNSGIGFETALALARHGAELILPARTQAKADILSTAAHPGYAVTNLQADHLKRGLKILITVMKPFLSQDAARGALPTLFAAVAAEAVAGGYYGPDGFAELKGYPTAVSVPKGALDETIAPRLWVESERLTNVKFGAL